MAAKRIMITGADGYIGLRLARRFLATTDDPLLLFVRADHESGLRAKRARLARALGQGGPRVRVAAGDLTNELPFAAIDPKSIRAIVHAAAATRFNVDRETARRVNIEGTEKLLRFADECASLDALELLSTIYASGLRPGRIEENAFDATMGFANNYEWSKWRAESVLLGHHAHLPWRIHRLATIIADDESGMVAQYNAFHNTLRLYGHGLLSLVPGLPETPLYFITGDFATEAIFNVMAEAPRRSICHVTHRMAESTTLGELIAVAFDVFQTDADFRRRRVMRPLFADIETFKLLSEGMAGFAGGIVRQALESVTPFAEQLFVSKDIRNDNLVAAHCDCASLDPRNLVRRTCAHLLRTRWGRESPYAA